MIDETDSKGTVVSATIDAQALKQAHRRTWGSGATEKPEPTEQRPERSERKGRSGDIQIRQEAEHAIHPT